MLARLFVIFGGLFVLALLAALVAPFVVDWSSYRADFEREASAVLGRKVTVHGEATATILPFPSVTFSDVEVAGGPGGAPAMTAETFSMDAELAPLLSGEFRIFDMRLVRPNVTIEIAEDGAVDWAMRPSSPFSVGHVTIEKLTVTEGQVSIVHRASGRVHRLTEINSEVSARALAGPWRMVGSMRVDGWRSAVTINTGRASNGAMRLRIQAEPEAQKVSLDSDGELRFDGNSASAKYSGEFRLAARRDPVEPGTPPPAGGPGFRVKGKFALDSRRLALEPFSFETGPLDNPYSAEGRGFIDYGSEPHFALTLDGAQVRFDDAIGAGAQPGTQAAALTLAQRLAALQESLLDLPRPSMPGTLDVKLPAVVAGDTTIRDVRLSAEPATGGWTVRSLAATLPGRATLEANGLLSTDETLGFRGRLLLAIAQPSGFAAWVSQDVDEAIRRLPAAGFSADVDLGATRQAFDNMELGLGGAAFHGAAERLSPANAAPATTLKLSGGALDVDGLAALASLFVSDLGVNRFAEGDLDLEVKAGPVSAVGLTAQSVDTAFRLRQGLLEIDRLSISDIAGATISATGTLRDFPQSPSGNLDASLVAVDLAPLIGVAAQYYRENAIVQALQARAAANGGLFEDARIDVVATAAAHGDGDSGVAISANGAAGGTSLSATLSGRGKAAHPGEADVSILLSGRNDDATRLLALYGLNVLPLGLTGPGETEFSLKGKLSGGLATSASLTAGDFSAGFAGAASLGANGVSVKGPARLNAADIEPWLMTTGVAIPGMGAGLPVDLEADLDYGDGLLVLDGIRGAVNQGAVSGAVNASLKGDKPHLSGELTLDEVTLDPLVAMVLGESALQDSGEGWPTAHFAPKVAAPFSADVGITTATLVAGPAVTAYDAGLRVKLDDEGLRLSELSATLYDGKASGFVELKNNGGTALFSSQLRLENADIASLLANSGLAGRGDISTSLSASGKSVGGLVTTLSGAGTARFGSLVVDGVNAAAFPAFIARADQFGKDIDAARTASFAPAIAADGSFTAEPGEMAFSIAAGVLRAPPLALRNAAAAIDVNLQSDFNTGDVAANGVVTFAPGNEALVGSEPALRFSLRGPLGATVREVDSQPLAEFLMQRALEAEQARVEGMQSALLEKQRLRREVRYYAALQEDHDKATKAWRLQQQAEAEARRKAQEEARLKAEAEEQARRAEAEKARLEAEEKARIEAEERARLAAEEAARQAAETARLEAEAAAQAAAEEKARLEAEAQAQREAEQRALQEAETARREAEAAARAEAEARERGEAEERARREAEERRRLEAEAARRAAVEKARLEEEERARREAANATPFSIEGLAAEGEAAPRPPAEVPLPAKPDSDAPQPKPDGFWEMLNGP